jgi:general secretion pathway protein D
MRTLLATILLGPALALAQVPARPPLRGALPGQRPPPGAPQPPGLQNPPPPTATTAPPTAPPEGPTAVPGAVPPAVPGATVVAAPPGPKAAPGAAAIAAPPGPPAAPARNDAKCTPIQGRFMLSFTKADIVDVLEQASRWTCRNFIYGEDVAKGKITLLSKSPVTADEAYAAFLAALNSNNIALYQTGRYWKLIRTGDAKKTPIPTYTTDGIETPATEQPITKVIRLKHADADQMRGIMGNFISPQGADLQAIPPDLLLITDIGVNIRRIEKLIDSIDRAGGGDLVRLVQIRYAPVKEIADKVNQIFGQAAGAPSSPRRRPGRCRSQGPRRWPPWCPARLVRLVPRSRCRSPR